MRLLLDAMLGRLARDLRLLGHDAAYVDDDADDDQVLHRARDEGRLLLTRDRILARRAGHDAVLIQEREPERQLHVVMELLGIAADEQGFLTRCSVCNTRLEVLDQAPGEAVPEDVRRRGLPLHRCPSCRRVYWEGSHVADLRRRLGLD